MNSRDPNPEPYMAGVVGERAGKMAKTRAPRAYHARPGLPLNLHHDFRFLHLSSSKIIIGLI